MKTVKPLLDRLTGAPVRRSSSARLTASDEQYEVRVVEDAFAGAGLSLPAEWEWSRSCDCPRAGAGRVQPRTCDEPERALDAGAVQGEPGRRLQAGGAGRPQGHASRVSRPAAIRTHYASAVQPGSLQVRRTARAPRARGTASRIRRRTPDPRARRTPRQSRRGRREVRGHGAADRAAGPRACGGPVAAGAGEPVGAASRDGAVPGRAANRAVAGPDGGHGAGTWSSSPTAAGSRPPCWPLWLNGAPAGRIEVAGESAAVSLVVEDRRVTRWRGSQQHEVALADYLHAERAAGLVRIVDADHGEEQVIGDADRY